MVQVVKDPLGTKGPASPPTSPCHPVIWSSCRAVPTSGFQRIESETERERLKNRGRQVDELGGYIIRTAAEGVGSGAGAGYPVS